MVFLFTDSRSPQNLCIGQVICNREIDAGSLPAALVDNHLDHRFGGTGKHGAPENNRMRRILLLQASADLAGDFVNVIQGKLPIA